MPVQFGPLRNDGSMLVDGVHDATCSNQLASQILTALGLPTGVPGQAQGRLVYDNIVAFMQSPTYQAMSPPNQALVDKVRIAVAAGARIESGLIGWRAA
jgi:hypothetical protein